MSLQIQVFDENDHDGEGWKPLSTSKEFHRNLVDYFALDESYALVNASDIDDVKFIESYANIKEAAAIEMLQIIREFGIIHFALPEVRQDTAEQAEGASNDARN